MSFPSLPPNWQNQTGEFLKDLLARKAIESALSPVLGPIAPYVASGPSMIGPLLSHIPDEQGLPVNPVYNEGRALDLILSQVGMGQGWREASSFIDRSPDRNPIQQAGDRLGILGKLLATSSREIGEPSLGAFETGRALARMAGLEGLAAPIPGIGPLVGLMSVADPHPETRALPEIVPGDQETTRTALRDYWARGSKDETVPMTRFLAEILADPTNLLGTRTAATTLERAGMTLASGGRAGNLAARVGGVGIERMGNLLNVLLDLQDESFKLAGGGIKSAIGGIGHAVPWAGALSREGQIGDFRVRLNDIFHALRTSRIPIDDELAVRGVEPEPAIDLSLPRPWEDLPKPHEMPSITHVRGQLTRDQLVENLSNQADEITTNAKKVWRAGLNAAPDKAAYRTANPFPDNTTVETLMDQTEARLAASLASRVRAQNDPSVIPGVTTIVQHGAAQLDQAGLAFEQKQAWLATQERAGAIDADDAAEALRADRAEYINALTDIHSAITDALDRAVSLRTPGAQNKLTAETANWQTTMADLADQIDDLPKTRQMARDEIAKMMLADPAPSPLWTYGSMRNEIEAKTAPAFVQRLYGLSQSDPAMMAATFKASAPVARQSVETWAQYHGWGRPVADVADLTTLMRDIQASKTPDEGILVSFTNDVQDVLQATRLAVFEARAKAADFIRASVLNKRPDLADVTSANNEFLVANFLGDLGERTLGRGADGGLTGGRYEAYLSPEQSAWFRSEASAPRANELLSEMVTDRKRIFQMVKEGAATRGIALTNDEIATFLEDPRAALREASALMEPTDVTAMRAILEKWRGNLFTKPENEHFQTLALLADRMVRDKATSLGIKEGWGGPIGRALNHLGLADSVFQEEALAQPGTLMTNLMSGVLLAAHHGYDTARIVRTAAHNAATVFRSRRAGRDVLAEQNYLPNELQDVYRDLEIEPPGNLTGQTRGAIAVQSGEARARLAQQTPGLGEPEVSTAIERVHPVVRGIWGALEGANRGAPGGPGMMVASALLGAAYRVRADPEIKVVTSALYDAVEGAMRGSITYEAWERVIPVLGFELERLLKAYVPGRQMIGPRVSPGQEAAGALGFARFSALADAQPLKPAGNPVEAIKAAFANGPLVPARRVRQIVMEQGGSVEDATRAGQEWNKILHEASQWTAAKQNEFNFDYIRTSNLEEFVRKFALFPIWPMRFAPLFITMLMEQPKYLWAILKFNDMSERVNKESNRPAGMVGYLGGGLLGTLLANTMYGRAGALALNLTRSVAGQVEGVGGLDDTYSTNPVGKAIETAQKLGFGLRPQFQVPLELLGILNPSPFEMLRSNPMNEALTTTALNVANAMAPPWVPKLPTQVGTSEAPLLEARRFLRSALSPITGATTEEPTETGSAIKDQMIRRRIVELAYEQNGQRPQGPYAAALNSPDASPQARQVWEAAREDVEKVIAAQTIISNLTPARARYISDTETTLRGEQAKVQDVADQARQTLTQRRMAGILTPDQAAALEAQAIRKSQNENPLSTVLSRLGASTANTEQRARAEFETYTKSIGHLPYGAQVLLIQRYLNSRPDIATAIQYHPPSAAERRYNAVPVMPGAGR